MSIDVVRKSDEMGIIWGYASVADIVDLQGDVVPAEELVRAVYQFMEDYYAGAATIKENHDADPEVVLVESTLNVLAGHVAWFVGVKLLTEELRQAARDGEISGFSIGGWAEENEEDANG
jgi:DNA adenine methylase